MDVLLAILVVYGIVNILVNGAIFNSFRNILLEEAASANDKMTKTILIKLHKLFSCVMCSAFWVGLLVGIFLGPYFGWYAIFNGFLFSATSWILNSLVQFLGSGYDPARTINVVISEDSKINVKVNKDG